MQGGTTIEGAFFPEFGQPVVGTCCHGRILSKFRNETEHYCAQKFTSWQVSFRKFYEVVETCRRMRGPAARNVVWVTFREPIATFVSLVHQMCNKNLAKRDPDKLQACEVCEYTNETAAVWKEYAQSVEWQIKGAYQTSHKFLTVPNTTTVIMEPSDLNEFYVAYHNGQRTLQSSNPERNSMCSFRPTSNLIKAMRVSNQVYRRLVAGLRVSDEVIDVNGVLPGRASDTNKNE